MTDLPDPKAVFDPNTKHSYITTLSGRRINLSAIRPEQIEVLDVAHSLGLQCRYMGHCFRFYSVGEHVNLVAGLAEIGLEPPTVQLCALLHDAAEAYTGDHPSPMKTVVPEIRDFENTVEYAVIAAFGLPRRTDPIWQTVKRYDIIALHVEAAQLFRPAPPWVVEVPPEYRAELGFWDPYRARNEFLENLYLLWLRVPQEWRDRAAPQIQEFLKFENRPRLTVDEDRTAS